MRVSWQLPAKPNGDIISYRTIVNRKRKEIVTTEPSSEVLTGLKPYTVYEIQVSLTILAKYEKYF